MSKTKKQKRKVSNTKNRTRIGVLTEHQIVGSSLASSTIPMRATIATFFTLFLMFLAWIVGYVWGFAAGQFSYVNSTVAYKSARHAALKSSTPVASVHERTAQVREIGDDYFLLYFPDTKETAKAVTTIKTAYHIPAPRATVPSSYAAPAGAALGRQDIHVGEMVMVTSSVNISHAVQFVVNTIAKIKES